jgi:type I restriction enzyme, S subunit
MREAARSEWPSVTVGDVIARVVDRRINPLLADGLERYVGVDDLDSDELQLRRWGEVRDGQLPPTFRYAFPTGSVLFPTRRPKLRKCAIAPFAGITGEKILVLQSLDSSRLDPGFMPFLLTSEGVRRWVVDRAIGSVTPHFRWRDLASYVFSLPPLQEQRRTADLLGACQQLSNSYLALAAQTEQTYRALLSFIFAPRMKTSSACDATPATGTRWVWKRVDERFALQLGKMSSKNAREGREQTSYIKNNNVLWDRFVLEDLPQMSFSDVERRKFSLRPGDLLVCEGGEIGRSAIWVDVDRQIVYQKALHRLRPRDSDVSPRFFLHYLRYCAAAGVLEKIATGTTILHLPQERLGALRLPFPDIEAQVSIVDELDTVVRAAAEARKRVEDMRAVKSMLMERVLAR